MANLKSKDWVSMLQGIASISVILASVIIYFTSLEKANVLEDEEISELKTTISSQQAELDKLIDKVDQHIYGNGKP